MQYDISYGVSVRVDRSRGSGIPSFIQDVSGPLPF
jgi:hypothetical protein